MFASVIAFFLSLFCFVLFCSVYWVELLIFRNIGNRELEGNTKRHKTKEESLQGKIRNNEIGIKKVGSVKKVGIWEWIGVGKRKEEKNIVKKEQDEERIKREDEKENKKY